MDRKVLDSVYDKIIGLSLLLFGLAFAASPAHDFIQSHDRHRDLTPSHQADVNAILGVSDQASLTEVSNILLKRDDVARVNIVRGSFEYPEFEITLGKNQSPREIGDSVNVGANGTHIYIGYFPVKKSEAVTIWDDLRKMQPMGSFLFGICMVGFGLFLLFIPLSARGHIQSQPVVVEKRPEPPTPSPEPTPPSPEPVKYEGLRIVKGG